MAQINFTATASSHEPPTLSIDTSLSYLQQSSPRYQVDHQGLHHRNRLQTSPGIRISLYIWKDLQFSHLTMLRFCFLTNALSWSCVESISVLSMIQYHYHASPIYPISFHYFLLHLARTPSSHPSLVSSTTSLQPPSKADLTHLLPPSKSPFSKS